MSHRLNSALGAALVVAAATGAASPAFAHAVCGARIFPATLGIDDPGVGDEIALPTVTYLPTNSGWQNEADVTFSYSKTILPDFAISVQDGASFVNPQGWGRVDLVTEEKWKFLCIPEVELMASVGFSQEWGKTYTNGMGSDFNTYQPVVNAGIGFGGLPRSLDILRPVALTGELSYSMPDQSWTSGNQNASSLNWGFTIQYSLPYFNANVAAINNEYLKHLVAVTEFTFSKPVYNFAPGTNVTTGTIQPGLMYTTGTYQVSLEAILPINSASGHGVGVVGELHFYLDDIFPNSLGKPIFGASK